MCCAPLLNLGGKQAVGGAGLLVYQVDLPAEREQHFAAGLPQGEEKAVGHQYPRSLAQHLHQDPGLGWVEW